jgi:hypothetical protein
MSAVDPPASTGASWGPPAPRRAQPVHHRWLEVLFVIGLAGVFLVNAAVAVVSPSDFTDLIDRSSLAGTLHLTGSTWIAGAIFVHDILIGLAIVATLFIPRRGIRLAILAWAGLWLFVVAVVKLTAL